MDEFKLVIAGGRDFNDYEEVNRQLIRLANGELAAYAVSVVSGMARGADALGAAVARDLGVQLYEFPADWNQYGKRAGILRNEEMGRFADGLLAFWDGHSRGTKHMIEFMQGQGKPVRVIRYGDHSVPLKQYNWNRRGGYECSSKGDKRFSAFCAYMPDGRTIEQHYQCDVKGYQPGGSNWRLGKGKPPLDPNKDLYAEYLGLWKVWAEKNPHLIEELRMLAGSKNNTLSDCFATSQVNQARALADILNGI